MRGYNKQGSRFNKIAIWLTVLALIFFVFFVATGGILSTNYNQLGNLVKVFTLIRTQYIEEAQTANLVDGAIHGMVEALDDPYSVYLDEETFKQLEEQIRGSFGGLGILVGVKDDLLTVMRVYEDTPAHRAGINDGDRITEIDGRDVRGTDLETAIGLMRGPVGTKIELSVLHEDNKDDPVELEIIREEISVPTVDGKMLPESRIGYMLISQFNEKTPDEVLDVLADLRDQGMRGLILDLRDNPGGELGAATRVADNFVPKGPIVYIDYRSGDEDVKSADDNYLQLPLAVLVNENSASAAEILAGAIKDTETGVLVGTTTFGKGIVQTVFPLNSGSGPKAGLKLTTARYLTPDKHDIHEKGIEPDVEVEYNQDAPGDAQLDRAVEIVKEQVEK